MTHLPEHLSGKPLIIPQQQIGDTLYCIKTFFRDAATNEQKEQAIESSVPLDLDELRQRVREKREREASGLNPEASQKFEHSEKPVTSESKSRALSREPSVVTSQSPTRELEEA